MPDTLYGRLGGSEAIQQIASDLIDNHINNPQIAQRFVNSDAASLKKIAAEFFTAGAGGPHRYKGKDMVDDAMAAMEKNNVGQREKEEVLFIFFSLKGEVVRV